MTNVEKWKAELSTEALAELFSTVKQVGRYEICPAAEFCIGESYRNLGCRNTFIEWANKLWLPQGHYCTGCDCKVYRNGCEYCKEFQVYLHYSDKNDDELERCEDCKKKGGIQ